MFTPVLKPNSPTTPKSNSSISPIHIQLGQILRQHDPNAIRLYDFISHVKLFLYNTTTFHWENNSYIEGNLFSYERQQIINNQVYPSYVFAIINEKQNFIQEITLNISSHVDKLRLFYETITNDKKHQVYCLHFLNENQCQRLNAFISQSIRNIKEQQISTGALQPTQITEQSIQSSFPIPNSNHIEDPTSSLKRLLNIPNQNTFDNGAVTIEQLLPPSAFESQPTTPPSPIGAERSKNRLMQTSTTVNREHFRHILLDLVQNNDHFLDIIHQACVTHSSE